MKFIRSKIAITTLLIGVGLTIFLWDAILATLFSAYFKNYFRTQFNAEIAVERVHKKKKSWVLKGSSFTFPGGDLTAKQIDISYEPFLWDRKVEVRVKVIDPLFKLTDQSLAILDGLKKLDVDDGLLDYQIFVEVENGCATADHLPTLYFSLKDELGPYSQCKFHGGFSGTNQVQGTYLFQADRHPYINLVFDDFDLEAASKWVEHLHPGALEWTSQGGRIEGNWSMDKDYYYGAGDLKITDLTLTSSDNPFSVHIPTLTTVKSDTGTVIKLEKKGKLGVLVEKDFSIDLYHFGGDLMLNPLGELQGLLAGSASIGAFQPGLQVEIIVDQPRTQDLFAYTIKGPLKSLLTQLPQKYQHIMEDDFDNVDAELIGRCTHIVRGVELNTDIKLLNKGVALLDDFKVYCRIDPTTSNFIDEGSFIASSVDLESIVTPFLFVDKQFKLSGEGYFEGTWNPSLLHVKYAPKRAVLECESFALDIPENPQENDVAVRSLPGEHFFDFDRNHQYGRLYVEKGFYLEKRTGLLFTDLSTQFVFEGKTLHATQVQTCCQGIDFQGIISLDYSSPLKKTFDLALTIEKMEGKVSQFQNLLGHFPQPLFLQKLPFEGNIMNGRGDNKISLQFVNGKCTVDADIKGVLVDGHTSDPNFPIRADQLSFEFAYNHENKTLGLKNLGGLLHLGIPEKEKILRIQGEGFQFKNYLKHEGEFSIALRDERHEWIKLAGDISPVKGRSKEDLVRLTFDPGRSHLQDGQSIHCMCEISDWENVEDLDLSFQLKVPGVVKELQQSVECGLVTLPEPFVDQLNDWVREENTDGQLMLNIGYDRLTSLINLQARGKQVQLGNHHYDQVNLEAKKRHHTWMIEQLQFDDLSFSADLQKAENDWKLNFLGVRWGDALLAGLEGSIDPDANEMKAHINLFEMDLSKALDSPRFKQLAVDKRVAGELKGVGELTFKLIDKAPGWTCDILGNLNTKSVVCQDVAIEDAHNVSFHLLSDETISLRNLKTKAMGVDWMIEKCSYSPKVGQIEMENVAFSYPVNQGAIWMTALQYHFPDLMDQQLRATIEGLKSEGTMEGFFDFILSENVHEFKLRLHDDTYYWKGDPYAVKNFTLFSTPTEKAFLFQTAWEKILPWVYIKTGNGEKGNVILAESNPLENPDHPYLTIDWKNAPNRPVSVDKISGRSFGVGAELLHRGDDYVGTVSLQLPEMAPLLSEENLHAVQKSQLKGTYEFNGVWNLPFQTNEWFDQFSFNGHLYAASCVVKGFCYEKLQAECALSPGRFQLQNCQISDIAFDGELQNLLVSYSKDKSSPAHFQLNHLQLNNLRPFLLKKDPGGDSFSKKSLNINELQVSECSGVLSEPETYQGKAFLQFTTQVRKGVESTPFALPAEILSRIGLNSAIMTPVMGSALFEIAHGRCYISKLKDTYSQGKLSKFNIYSSKEPSYIDFDGNVHVQVRIKHYNLLFKLSEMLTIHIRGTLQKPLYYLQKQPKDP